MSARLDLTPEEREELARGLAELAARTGREDSLNALLGRWSAFVTTVERGYDDSIYEYTNDLSVRDQPRGRRCGSRPGTARQAPRRARRGRPPVRGGDAGGRPPARRVRRGRPVVVAPRAAAPRRRAGRGPRRARVRLAPAGRWAESSGGERRPGALSRNAAESGPWCCGARPESGRRRCWSTWSSRRSELTVVRAAGVESEMELAFAGLHQLCAPLLDRLNRLPAPQHEALDIAFGLRAGAAAGPVPGRPGGVEPALRRCRGASVALCPRRRAVAGSGLGAGARVRSPSPAGRAVGLVFAVGSRARRLQHLPELECTACATGTHARCCSSAVRFQLDERVRDRIIAETRGNPLALLELPRGLTATQLAGGFGLPDAPALIGADRGELRPAGSRRSRRMRGV